jgi:hypothetical protein
LLASRESEPQESEMERCSLEDFVKRFQMTVQGHGRPSQATAAGSLRLELHENEFWHWVLFGLVGLMVFEFVVANRTPM